MSSHVERLRIAWRMDMSIEASPLPDGALLERYREMPGAYWDCYAVSVGRSVSAAEFIEAFYTTPLFRCERLVLRLIGRGCTDDDVRALAAGSSDGFAAWTVEARSPDQILVRDFTGATRSWLMVGDRADGREGTRLYFGSAGSPGKRDKTGHPRPSATFRALLPLHNLYARSLLRAAVQRLAATSVASHAP